MSDEGRVYVDPDDIEFGESRLPPPLPFPTAEAIGEALAEPAEDSAPDAESSASRDGPVFVDLREREMRDVHWHDRPFLPAGELITNNADGDTGKGLYSVHYAARFSRGEFGDRRMVVFVVAEDDFDTVLKPRLVAAEANLATTSAASAGGARAPRTRCGSPTTCRCSSRHLLTMQVGLFVIDPLLSHLSAKTNSISTMRSSWRCGR